MIIDVVAGKPSLQCCCLCRIAQVPFENMNRRSFLRSTLAAVPAATLPVASAAADGVAISASDGRSNSVGKAGEPFQLDTRECVAKWDAYRRTRYLSPHTIRTCWGTDPATGQPREIPWADVKEVTA